MRTPSGILHVVDFKTDQIIAAIQPQDYWDDKRHWELKNNVDMLDFTAFDGTDHSATLQQQNLVLKEVRDGRIVPYVITETEKNSDKRSITTYASGAWIQIAKSGIIKPQRIESKTVNEFIDLALLGMKWQRGITEYAGFHTMTIDEYIDPLTFLKKIASLFKLEIRYRVEVKGSKIIGWYVDMIQKRGYDTGKEIELGKDLVGVTRIEHTRNICTALVGFVKGEGDKVITIESINNGLPYIVDADAFQRWSERGQHKFGFYTPETEELDMTPKRLLTLMEIELKKRVNSSISYEVEAQSIGRIFGLEHELINEGDTIKIKDTGFTPELYLEARVIAGDESFTDPTQDKYEFGDYREIANQNEELRKIYNRILSSLGNKQEMIDQLDQLVKEANETASNAKKESEAAKTLAEKVQENIKNNTVEIIEAKNPPTIGLKPYKTLWRDISNGKPGILKIWTGTAWESVVPDVESVKKETLDQVNKDIESTKTELNQKVQTVESKAQEIAEQIVDVQNQVNNKVDQTWIDNQLKDKADKTGVYTKEEIKDGFIGKQVYETDKQGNVQKFKDINTSIGQTNEALTQKAEKSELTKTNDGLTKLQNKTNEIETTANGTKQKLSELETTVNNTNVGGRNYVLDSDKFISPPNTMQSFKFVNDLKDLQGKQVTLSVYVEIKNAKTGVNPSNRIGFEPSIRYSDNSIQHLGAWLRITEGVNFKGVISTTLWIKDIEILKTEQNAVYIQCGGDYVKVGRPKIEIGNKVTDWTPAPEDQVTTTDFTKKTVEIETTIKGINTTVSNIQNEQGKLTERMTKSEQTADGFKTSIESLTKKEGEISSKLNTVEQTVEGTKKTLSDVQQTTGELKKTTTELKEQAGKITEKLTSVETKVNNDKAGGRNLVLDSNIKYEKTDYLINQYSLTENFFTGEEYTFVIKGSVPQGQKFGIWQNGGSNNVGYATSVYANGITYVTFKAVATTSGNERKLSLYNYPSNTTKAIVEWVALYKGNKPQDWTPAPENQVTTDEFTKKTTEIEKSVDGVKTSVTNVQNSQAGFEKRMSTVEQTASGLSSTVSDLNNVVSDQEKKLTEANTKLEQQATAIGAKVELKQVEDYVAGFKIPELKQTVNQNKQDLLDELANKLATEQFNQKMTLIDNRFTINELGINAAAKKTEVYTRIQADGQFAKDSYVRDMESRLQLTEKGVSISVKENDVIAAINMSKENIKLNAARIDLVGKVNAEWIKAGLLSGCQIRTSNTDNYVSLDDQFIRLYERGVARAFLGHYRRSDGAVQPTFILGSDEKTNAPEGTLFMSQAGAGWSGAYASIGISNGIVDGAVQKSVYWELQRNGLSVLNANDYHVFYAGNGSWYFRRGKTGLYQTSLVLEDNGTDSDLRLPNVTIRNSRAAGYTGVIQLKSSVTQNGWGAVQGNFMTPSLREYKSNIRDISFSALEKIRSLKIRQFNYKNAVNELYRMREERSPNDPPLTTEDIKTYYGLIVDECDEMFVDESGKGVHLYSYASIGIKGLQEVDATVQEQEVEIENLKSQVASQEDRIARLEELLLQQLIDKKPEQP
ncbi:tail fiber domain-containing protein [Bacillus tropicus]|uniref:phage tail spike protein n=2 Tax=Bacillus cereus group TaxID=86661 RepID=UPI000944055A|nr:phage tail spike protein [Bacillus tropicus]MCU5423104.1 tail fiber domain-containing protein [Bacillus tropicus]